MISVLDSGSNGLSSRLGGALRCVLEKTLYSHVHLFTLVCKWVPVYLMPSRETRNVPLDFPSVSTPLL